jgi:glucose/arabinose dehydrogenase
MMLAAGCTATASVGGATPSPSPSPARPQLALVPLGQFSSPVWVGPAPGDRAHLFLAEKTGRVLMLDAQGRRQGVVLDLRKQISKGNEQGLLSIAFDPDFTSNHRFYAFFTDKSGTNVVVAYPLVNGVAGPPQQLLGLSQPYPNHNGGLLLFDGTGMLLVGTGDGGSAGDPDNRAQDLASPFGKLLRVDPRTGLGARGNPFPAYPRVWAVGLRNPLRASFDANGDLYLTDVGQNREEELDVVPPGHQRAANYGWSVYEGDLFFKRDELLTGGGEQIAPALAYPHEEGACSITGGQVYRGTALAFLRGSYVFGDYCVGRLWAVDRTHVGVTLRRELGVGVAGLQGFGSDADGELLVMSAENLYRLTAAPVSAR